AINALPALHKLIENHNGPVIATHDTHFNKVQVEANWPPESGIPYEESLEGKKLPVPHCIKLSEGWEIEKSILEACQAKNIDNKINFRCIDKYTFGWLGWKDYLNFEDYKDVDEIIIAGFCTDICVVSNALILRATYPNKKITVIENACAGVTKETHNAAIATMKMCQIDVENI
ncbi:MAG: isochorismatase family protein, partial [Bacilli bacterium]|nr:isochorismatase family protein [Bacilli bacterium]